MLHAGHDTAGHKEHHRADIHISADSDGVQYHQAYDGKAQ